jgi:hypothetical protein
MNGPHLSYFRARQKISEHLKEKSIGEAVVVNSLRDWLISRQRSVDQFIQITFPGIGVALFRLSIVLRAVLWPSRSLSYQ